MTELESLALLIANLNTQMRAAQEECIALNTQVQDLQRENAILRAAPSEVPPDPSVVIEQDGYKVYGPGANGLYSVSLDGVWVSGAYGKTAKEALANAIKES